MSKKTDEILTIARENAHVFARYAGPTGYGKVLDGETEMPSRIFFLSNRVGDPCEVRITILDGSKSYKFHRSTSGGDGYYLRPSSTTEHFASLTDSDNDLGDIIARIQDGRLL